MRTLVVRAGSLEDENNYKCVRKPAIMEIEAASIYFIKRRVTSSFLEENIQRIPNFCNLLMYERERLNGLQSYLSRGN